MTIWDRYLNCFESNRAYQLHLIRTCPAGVAVIRKRHSSHEDFIKQFVIIEQADNTARKVKR